MEHGIVPHDITQQNSTYCNRPSRGQPLHNKMKMYLSASAAYQRAQALGPKKSFKKDIKMMKTPEEFVGSFLS
jgi:hypothetical protein